MYKLWCKIMIWWLICDRDSIYSALRDKSLNRKDVLYYKSELIKVIDRIKYYEAMTK